MSTRILKVRYGLASVHRDLVDRLGPTAGFCRDNERTTAAAGVGQAAIGALVGQPGHNLGGRWPVLVWGVIWGRWRASAGERAELRA